MILPNSESHCLKKPTMFSLDAFFYLWRHQIEATDSMQILDLACCTTDFARERERCATAINVQQTYAQTHCVRLVVSTTDWAPGPTSNFYTTGPRLSHIN